MGFLYVWLYFAICSRVLVVLVKLSVLNKWLAIERPSSWGEEIISTKPTWKSVFVCIFLSFCLFMLLCVFPSLHNIYFIRLWHDIAPCAESSVKRQTKKHFAFQIKNSSKHNQFQYFCWRFGLCQRPSSEEACTSSIRPLSWHVKFSSCQEPEELTIPASSSDEGLW